MPITTYDNDTNESRNHEEIPFSHPNCFYLGEFHRGHREIDKI